MLTITCLKATIGVLSLLLSIVVFIYKKKVKRDKKQIEKLPDDYIDWELNLN